ncbi:MAG: hypothetical protein JNK23_00580 [Opitutaceae bacterium]|nr:hypothetical protein [Opitutaceae bacterium]
MNRSIARIFPCVFTALLACLAGCGRNEAQAPASAAPAASAPTAAAPGDSRLQQLRQEGQKTEVLSQVHRIGQAAVRRAQASGGKMPASIADLEQDLGGLALALAPDYAQKLPMGFSLWPGARQMKWIEENSKKSFPAGFETWTRERKAQWLDERGSFVLLPLTISATDPKAAQSVLVFEKLQFPTQASVAICYGDTSARTTDVEKASRQILAQTGKSLAEWSGLK